MAELGLRAVAVAGVLALGVLCGAAGAAPVFAQPTDPDGSSQDSDPTDDGGGTAGPTIGSTQESREPAETTEPDPDDGTDEETVEVEPDDAGVTDDAGDEPVRSGGAGGGTTRESPTSALLPPPQDSRKTEYSNSLTLPFFRLPAAEEIPEGSWPSVSSFYTTVEIPLPTLGEFLAALRVVPPPPPPGPSIRIQQEAPVLDAGTGTVGEGTGGGGSSAETPVFRAPLVVSVPRAMTVAGAGPRARAPRPGSSVEQATTAPGVAGVRTPRIRGSVAPTPGTSVTPASASGQMPRPAGYPRVLTGPTLAEIAAVALPGLAGLMLVTFGGGVLGYRQANSVRFVRTAGAERFLA
ncbi:hypothetical protein CRI77_17570 [Mycolicibacterium duvalii]|uniref:Uncharacterized protein n=1 Tax=Mycolicibacterium duvalii TaxID=39688 RepID=A0A7I7K7S7_9MYCO|nr:hypothetical protein [Mycolicibacterium duvalii]MCV7366192.1 hypothetical protein [Mycolicibacterium duvalii]PEG38843.1 hypothetical protein CRI77_17570 [Mycolicibacterium duvalii]BBX19644.1 hypothetical protein MDUV_45040 [Mycolicibacterium duvalii]